ncbi:helix-turn-helix domain-containing protein [Melghirimyces profundicolus]|uniref:helix-turn-helix domain-containing protein n=1 Tax=Melghirimyces profundicolus TaxID=1242148 RepID=UPI0011B25C36|nr:DUF4115 domain-containing protein [Melghirimyces profundicolus]
MEIGKLLRQAREEAGLSLDDLRDQTQIDTVTLQALENGNFDKISSPFYVRSYIRTYAKKVGLEPTNLLKKYRPIPEGDDGQGDQGNQNTGPLKQQTTSSFRPVNQSTGMVQVPLQQTGKHRPPEPPESPNRSDPRNGYDPYRSTRSEVSSKYSRVQAEEEPAQEASSHEEDPFFQDPGLPSRSSVKKTRSQTKKWSAARLTETMKIPGLGKTGRGRIAEDRSGIGHHGDSSQDQNHGGYGDDFSHDSYEGGGYLQEGLPSRSRTNPRSTSGLTGTGRVSGLSRSGRGSSVEEPYGEGGEDSFHAEGSPDLYGSREEDGAYTGENAPYEERSRFPLPVQRETGEGRLSRSTRQKAAGGVARHSKAKKKGLFSNKWMARVAVVSCILLIPMTVWAYSNMMDQPAEEQTQEKGQDVQTAGTAAEGTDLARVTPVNEGSQIGEYKLSEPSAVEFQFKAKGTSWIQIRETKNSDQGYVKDVTLKKGESFPFKQAKSVSTDLWVTIGSPEHVDVTINGQPVKAKRTLHVIKN